ncbi:acetyl-CoA acetyltransferase [Nocardia uniformis]|uniref:Probable acetyl-CoA acetyltransferase n=2 Tax=Nocardia uniformis TaxID=53432 RepID=A0A849CFY8_9NOCA|nr:acetyl-CoA acetyltransferase [Nocardia uniformis]
MRTPVGLPEGALAAVAPHRLLATALTAVIGRSGIDPHRIEHLVTAVPTPHTARAAAEIAGLLPAVGEFPVDSGPGSGMRALITAAMMVQTGQADVVVAIGAEYPWGTAESPRSDNADLGAQCPSGLRLAGAGAAAAVRSPGPVRAALERIEDLAVRHEITRAEADEFAAVSHRRAARARRQGVFGAEVAPVVVCADPDDMNSGVVQLVDRDEGLRDDVSPRAFATLVPLLPGGVITAANSSSRTFAASACLVVAEERLADLGLESMGYLVGWATADAAEPDGAQPTSTAAAAKVLARTELDIHDLDLVEVDETDAVEVLALHRWWGDWDPEGDRLNVHGGAIALGDPGGAAALRMVTTLLHELTRREGGRGLAVTSSGPSQSLAAVFESANGRPVAPTPRGARFHGARTRRSGRHRA